MSRAEVLVLPPRVDAVAVASLWQARSGAAPGSIDFQAVREIDSAGLAFVAALCGIVGGSREGAAPVLIAVPERFVQLCRAHRIDKELLS